MGITDGLKDVAKVLREADKIPQYQQILEVQEKLLEMQGRIIELEAENRNLKEKLEVRGSLKYERNSYWTVDKSEGPFCSNCWDTRRQQVQMHSGFYNSLVYTCPSCKVQIKL